MQYYFRILSLFLLTTKVLYSLTWIPNHIRLISHIIFPNNQLHQINPNLLHESQKNQQTDITSNEIIPDICNFEELLIQLNSNIILNESHLNQKKTLLLENARIPQNKVIPKTYLLKIIQFPPFPIVLCKSAIFVIFADFPINQTRPNILVFLYQI